MDNNADDARFFRMVEELILGYFGRQKYFDAANALREESFYLNPNSEGGRRKSINDRIHGEPLEKILKMFYESGNFVVPNCFTEFGDRLRQMTNEFTSLVGCYSTNQRILYGKNIASRKRNSTKNVRTSEGTEIISSSTSEVQPPQSDLSIIGVLATNGKIPQQCATQPVELSPETNAITTLQTSQQIEVISSDTHNIAVAAKLEQNEQYNRHVNCHGNRCTTPTYIIDSPNDLSFAQTLDNLPSDMLPSVSSTQISMPSPSYENFDSSNNISGDIAETTEGLVKEPTGRDVSSIRQTIRLMQKPNKSIRAHMEKRKRRKPMSQRQKIKNTIEKIASLANKTEAPKHDSDLERYIDAPDFLTNFDDWFEGINFYNLEGIEVMAQNDSNAIKTDPRQLQPEISNENSMSVIEHSTTNIVTERTSWKLVPLSPVKRPSRHYQRSAVGKEIEVQTVEKASQITNKISNDVEQSSQPDRAFNAQPDLSNNSKSCSQPSENGTRSERQGTMQNLSGDSTKEQIRKRLQNTEPDSMPIAEISNGITILWEENRTTLDDSPGCKKSKMGKDNCTDEVATTVDSMLDRDFQNSEPFDTHNTDFNVTDATQLAEAEMKDGSQLEEGELCSPEKIMSKSYKWKTKYNERSSIEVGREKREQSPGSKEITRKGSWENDRPSAKENRRKQLHLKQLQAIQPKPQCTPTKPKQSGSPKSKHDSRNERKTSLRPEMNQSVPVIAPYTVIFIDPSEGKEKTSCVRKVKEKSNYQKATSSHENSTKERNKPKDQKLLCRPSAAPKRMPA
ncbi:putative translation initiation factor IF-2 [Ditylenchus destructor]|uniref:Translation initiation factor IF-2 n=1 Tax=Ditylenchus destructor TaxID=166010 RepID=A0AAD4R4U7_9BILA|nr:putative translation initiation factor IF-2 [Ditylenchus destructor]